MAQWAAHSCVAHRPSRRPWPADRRALCAQAVGPPYSSITATLQHQPASSRATAVATTVERSPRRRSSCCQRWWRRRPAAAARAATSGRWPARRRSMTALARTGRRWCQAASTSSRRAWELPALVIGPRRWRGPTGLGRHQAQVGADAGAGQPMPVADLDRQREGGQRADPAQARQAPDHRRKARLGGELGDLLIEASRRRPAARTAP